MRLIDIDKITEHDVCVYLGMGYASCCDDVMDLLNDQPEVNAVQVKHGHWIAGGTPWISEVDECSECGYRIVYGMNFKFCPMCGTLMGNENNAVN